jgi:hypothetical protein
MQEDALSKGQKVLIVDDLIATGGETNFYPTSLQANLTSYLPYHRFIGSSLQAGDCK